MTNDWIIDVLTDLKKFSAKNRMGRLAEHLDDTILLAATELSLPDATKGMVKRFERTGESATTGGTALPGNGA